MSIIKSNVGVEDSNFYNHHRFDNYTGWLDMEIRKKNRAQRKALGFGYPVPRPGPPAKEEPEFVVQEAGFTSGKLLNRRYTQLKSPFTLEGVRTDPYHYPNGMRVTESQHYEDRRARSQHIDAFKRKEMELPRDRELAAAVPDELVKNHANPPATRMQIDPNLLKIKFDTGVKPQSHTVHELNVDLSCCQLPPRERPPSYGSKQMARTHAAGQAGGSRGREWSWCLGGRKPMEMPSQPEGLAKSASLPSVLGGASHMAHTLGEAPSPFYGTTSTQTFKSGAPDGRMRGGKLARQGYAGTFPDREKRC
mmetsp:Transcript_110496/g.195597  ORF Transcript_110496/g.195597 Transcript_110496/m.195597 type:complete len:307 (+) Transcript_110496:77-997(+)